MWYLLYNICGLLSVLDHGKENKMRNRRINLLKNLSNADGAPGFEGDVCKVIKESVSEGYETFEDNIRNTYIYKKGVKVDGSSPTKIRLGLDAHSDECSYIVAALKDNGLIKFLPLGGMLPASAMAQTVRIKNKSGEYVKGIITSTPVHFLKPEDKTKFIPWEKLFVDVGASSRTELQKDFEIEIGMPIIPDVDCHFNEKKGLFIGKAFDNRVGVAMILEVMRELADVEEIEIVGMVASQEEIGGRGTRVAVNRVKPDIAIVFEGTPSDDFVVTSDEAGSSLYKGTQIRYMDKGAISHPGFTKFAVDYANKEGLPLQHAVRSGGNTNAQFIHISGLGVPTIVLATPVRYVHTHNSMMALEDFESGVKYITGLIRKLAKLLSSGEIDPKTF